MMKIVFAKEYLEKFAVLLMCVYDHLYFSFKFLYPVGVNIVFLTLKRS